MFTNFKGICESYKRTELQSQYHTLTFRFDCSILTLYFSIFIFSDFLRTFFSQTFVIQRLLPTSTKAKMDLKTVCIVFVALAIVSIDATNTANSNTAADTYPVLTSSDTTGTATANLRSKRQFFGGYPGGFGSSNAFSSATAGAGGFGGFGGSNSFASATAGAGAGGLYGKKK